VSSDYLKSPGMTLSQVDIRPLRRFHAAIGGMGTIVGPHRYGRKSPIYSWRCRKLADVKSIISLLWPYLSEPKREQIKRTEDKFDKRSLKKGPTGEDGKVLFCPRGHSLSGANLYVFFYRGREHRRCKTCTNERSKAEYKKKREAMGLIVKTKNSDRAVAALTSSPVDRTKIKLRKNSLTQSLLET